MSPTDAPGVLDVIVNVVVLMVIVWLAVSVGPVVVTGATALKNAMLPRICGPAVAV